MPLSPDERADPVQNLRDKLGNRSAQVAVMGLGYVGLPLALSAAECGFKVVGLDIDPDKVALLSLGDSHIKEIPAGRVTAALSSGMLITTDLSLLRLADVIVICVPTPLTKQRDPDLSFVVSSVESAALYFRPGGLICLESTTYPGTTDEIVRPIFERHGYISDQDFALVFSPEREDPGNPHYGTKNIPKVVGGDSPLSTALGCLFYNQFIVGGAVPVSSSRAAEATKLTENIFRSVNIALVNELKIIFEAMDINIWEVIEAAKTKPFGYMPFYPGPGLGGHCIPIDPFYLTWKAKEYNMNTKFIELAGEINTRMPDYVVQRLADGLNVIAGRSLRGSRVLILGISYKKNVGDTRESPAFRIIRSLNAKGALVSFFDPHVLEIPLTREYKEYAGQKSLVWKEITCDCFDAAIIVTDHDDVAYRELRALIPIIVDTRNVLAGSSCGRSIVIRA